jgi:integrase
MATFRKRNNRWQVQVRSRQHGSISKSFHKKVDAQAWAIEQERLMQIGSWHKDLHSNTSITDLLKKYQLEVTPQKKEHKREIARLDRLIRDPIANLLLNECSPSDAAQFRDRRLSDGNRATEYDLVLLRHAWNIANKEWGWRLGDNPFSVIRFPRPSPARERRLHPHEYRMIREESRLRVWYLWPIVCLAIETGMRKSELLALLWSNVHMERNYLVIPSSKNGKSRTVPLTKEAMAVLGKIHPKSDLIFPVTHNALRLSWDRLMRNLDIKNLKFHDLRHEAISRYFEKGLSVPEVALISGHKTVSQLFRYVHVKIPERM